MFSQRVMVTTMAAVIGLAATASAQSTAALLEKGVYTEETIGDLDGAIEIYKQIIAAAEANRRHVAEAQLRLGACYLKTGQAEEAAKVLEGLIQGFAEYSDLVAEARNLLPENHASTLPLSDAPWSDGELLRFTVTTPTGAEIGDIIYSIERVHTAAGKAWRMDSYMSIPLGNVQKFSRVDAAVDDFRPVASQLKHSKVGEVSMAYFADKVESDSWWLGKDLKHNSIPLDRVVYDNEQGLNLMRLLPLAEGYKSSLPIMTLTGSLVDISFDVVGIETVTVPAGTFECFRTSVARGLQEQWFTTDRNRTMVKLVAREVSFELTEMTHVSDEPVKYRNEQAGLAVAAPPRWHLLEGSPANPEVDFWLQMLPPELNAWVVLSSMKMGTSTMPVLSARESADMDIKTLQKVHKDYTVRPDGWSDLQIAGREAASFIADYKSGGQGQVEYRVYIVDQPTLHWFTFMIAADKFTASKEEFDSIVETLTLNTR